MASPHTCGAVALMVSGLKAAGKPYSPFSIKRALENTASALPHACPYAQGHGLLQIERAFHHAMQTSQAQERDIRFAVTCNGSAKGINLRNAHTVRKQEVVVKIEPVFLNPDHYLNEAKINFNIRLALCSTSSWVVFPDHVDLMYSPRQFKVLVDPSGLPPGAHSAYIKGFDASCPPQASAD